MPSLRNDLGSHKFALLFRSLGNNSLHDILKWVILFPKKKKNIQSDSGG